ncbi:hypothetical protein ACOME3_010453 [Neoechinorhynchus agilis]
MTGREPDNSSSARWPLAGRDRSSTPGGSSRTASNVAAIEPGDIDGPPWVELADYDDLDGNVQRWMALDSLYKSMRSKGTKKGENRVVITGNLEAEFPRFYHN